MIAYSVNVRSPRAQGALGAPGEILGLLGLRARYQGEDREKERRGELRERGEPRRREETERERFIRNWTESVCTSGERQETRDRR
jgi:hypothetical protein